MALSSGIGSDDRLDETGQPAGLRAAPAVPLLEPAAPEPQDPQQGTPKTPPLAIVPAVPRKRRVATPDVAGDPLKGAAYAASQRDPQQWAKVTEMADRTGMQPDFVARNWDELSKVEANKHQQAQMEGVSSTFGSWLEDPDNATLAKHEMEPLSRVDQGARMLTPDEDTSHGFFSDAGTATATGMADFGQSAALLAAAYGYLDPKRASGFISDMALRAQSLRAQAPDYVGEYQKAMEQHGNDRRKAFEAWQASATNAEHGAIRTTLESLKTGAITLGEALGELGAWATRPRSMGYRVLESVPSLAPILYSAGAGGTAGAILGSTLGPAGAAAGGTVGGIWGTFVGAAPLNVGAEVAAELTKMKVDLTDPAAVERALSDHKVMAMVRSKAEAGGVTSAAVMSMFAGIAGRIVGAPTRALEQSLMAEVKAGTLTAAEATAKIDLARAASQASQGIVEKTARAVGEAGVQGIGVAAGGEAGAAAKGEPIDFQRFLTTTLDMTFAFGLPTHLIGESRRALFSTEPTLAAREATVKAQQALRATHDAMALSEVGDALKQAETTGGLPERIKSLVETATGGRDAGTVYFQSEAWNKYWQEQGASPAKAAADILGDNGKAYHDAETTGAQIAIPLADYIAHVGPTPHWEGLLEQARMRPDGMSLGEAHEYLQSLPATMKDIATEAGEKPATPATEASQKVGADVEAQLRTAGRSDSEAKAVGSLYERTFRALGERTGLDPHDLYQRYLLRVGKVEGEAAPGALQKGEATIEHTPLEPSEGATVRSLKVGKQGKTDVRTFQNEELPAAILHLEKRLRAMESATIEGTGAASTPESIAAMERGQQLRVEAVREDLAAVQAEVARRAAGGTQQALPFRIVDHAGKERGQYHTAEEAQAAMKEKGLAEPTTLSQGAVAYDTGHKREESSGRYVGAPNWVGNKPQALASLRAKLAQFAVEGAVGRWWYEDSSKAILKMVGGDKKEAEKIVSLIAIYSPNATVAANTTMALTAYYQWKAGLPIHAATGAADAKAKALLEEGKAWGGIKTNNFYQNLMLEIDPSKVEKGASTMDMWIALAMGYPSQALDQGPKYTFAQREIARAGEALGWAPHQAQAAIWTAMKARVENSRPEIRAAALKKGLGEMVVGKDGKESFQIKEGKAPEYYKLVHDIGWKAVPDMEQLSQASYHFGTALKQRMVQVSWEAEPGATSGMLPGLHYAPIEQKIEYLKAVSKALTTADGKDAIAEAIGLPQGETIEGLSAWEGRVGAGGQTFIAAPSEGSGKNRTLKAPAKLLLDAYAAMRGYVMSQDAVVWHQPIFDEAAMRQNGADLTTARALTEAEMHQLYSALHDAFGTWDIAPAYTERGARLLNFVDGLDNKTFQAKGEGVIAALPEDFGGGEASHAFYRSDGNYLSNDWRTDPNGEKYASLLAERSPDLPERAAALRARVETVNRDFAQRYDWDNPNPARRPPQPEDAGRAVAAEGIRLLEQPAWHGSPHVFDQFSLQHVGSGEGEQVYGWGLYFAGRKEVAEHYRNVLANDKYFGKGKQLTEEPDRIAAGLIETRGFDDALKYAQTQSKSTDAPAQRHWSRVRDAVEALRGVDIERRSEGRLYKVEIPEDDAFLNHDGTVAEQGAKMKRMLDPLTSALDPSERRGLTARGLYEMLIEDLYEEPGRRKFDTNDLPEVHSDVEAAKEASQYLASLGIAGLRYADNKSRGGRFVVEMKAPDGRSVNSFQFKSKAEAEKAVPRLEQANAENGYPSKGEVRDRGAPTHNYVVFDDKLVKIMEFEQANGGGARGRITFGPERSFNIDLLAKADRSTFLHETGHFYLEVLGDLARAPDAAAGLVADHATVLKWLGAEADKPLTTAQHEQFARGFEAYLMEGKAPSAALRGTFYRYKTWLLGIYKSLTNLDVQLTPEVRAVFDRLLATKDEIAAEEARQQAQPMFADPRAVGMTEDQADRYQKAVEEAHQQAEESLSTRMMKDVVREQSAEWKAWRDPMVKEITTEVNARPEYKALAFLQKGENSDGTPLPDGTPRLKINRQSVIDTYGPEFAAKLPRGILATPEKGGTNASVIAEMFGFRNGRELMDALSKVGPKQTLIEYMADQRMQQEHGERPTAPEIQEAAKEAVRGGEKRAALLRMELEQLASEQLPKLKGLIRQVTRAVPPVAETRAQADRIVGDTPVRDLKPNLYDTAAQKHGTDAREALLRGDVDAAFEAKRKQVLATAVYDAAVRAKEGVDKALDEFKEMYGSDERLAKSRDMDLVNAARAVLSSFGIGRTDRPAGSYLEQLRKYDPEMYETVNEMVNAATVGAADYKTISYADFADMRDAVAAMWDLSRRTRQIEIDGRKMDRQEVEQELGARLDELTPATEKAGYHKAATAWDKTKMGLMGVRASLRRIEYWVDALDDNNPLGAFRRYLWNPISEGVSNYRMAKKGILEQYLTIVKGIEETLGQEPINAPEIQYEFANKGELLGAMLHTGNESNLSKLLRGRQWSDTMEDGKMDTGRWDGFVRRMQKEGVLTKADYDYLQATWNLFEQLKAGAQKAHREMYGRYFSEITHDAFTTPYGDYAGGYYPAKADPFMVPDAAIRGEKESVLGSDNSFMFPTTGRGFTKARVEAYARPLIIDAKFVPSALDAVLRFTHIEPRVRDVARVVMSRDFRPTLDNFDPTVGGDMLVPWLQRSAQQRIDTPTKGRSGEWIDKAMREMRTRTGLSIMTANVVNALQQITGLATSMIKVAPRHMSASLWRYVRAPSEYAKWVAESSDFMATRETAQVMEIQKSIDNLLLNPSKYETLRAFAKEHGYFLSSGAQNIVDNVTWGAKYNEASERGASQREAVREADSAVRLTQGSFAAEDVSRFETGTPFQRAFTQFYAYFNAMANLQASEVAVVARTTGLRKGAGRLLYAYLLGIAAPAMLSEVLTRAASGNPLDEDDDGPIDDILAMFFGSQARFVTAMVPGVGPALAYGFGKYTGSSYNDRISVSPAISTLEATARTVTGYDAYQAIHDKQLKTVHVRDFLTSVSLLSGLPVTFAAKPISYLMDVQSGKAQPTGPIDFTRGLITGRPGKP